MVRNAYSASDAWQILQDFYLKRNIHNHVQNETICMISSLRETEMFGSFLNIRWYDQITKMNENRNGMDVLDAKEMLRSEFETIKWKNTKVVALNALVYKPEDRNSNWRSNENSLTQDPIKCSYCKKVGHEYQIAGSLKIAKKMKDEHAFSVLN